eukprot:CAMPEP_0204520320 /NCGR_PEP_ID=MMETSP0661-20131031/5203_1 /ASSEMBLY_ACC=CAM_ASM_000606 /TAXON_ID=109239 /ORGANISM="Alexandrium margalefi, Strain AMGDE01CS-322" /LENGTH=30 /DNA_ID= /DNA_START= /DNA_END= /DNA_ORIENTATION=
MRVVRPGGELLGIRHGHRETDAFICCMIFS